MLTASKRKRQERRHSRREGKEPQGKRERELRGSGGATEPKWPMEATKILKHKIGVWWGEGGRLLELNPYLNKSITRANVPPFTPTLCFILSATVAIMTPKKDHASTLRRVERSRVRAARIYQQLQGREKGGWGNFSLPLLRKEARRPPGASVNSNSLKTLPSYHNRTGQPTTLRGGSGGKAATVGRTTPEQSLHYATPHISTRDRQPPPS